MECKHDQAFARPTIPQADLPEVARNFEASLSHDDAIESVPSGESLNYCFSIANG